MVKHIVLWNFVENLSEEEKKEAALKMKSILEPIKELVPGAVDIQVLYNEIPSSNREVALIYGITRKEYSPMFYALPRRKFQTILFLQKMSELHKYTYEKIGHAPKYCRDTLCAQIVDMADTALYWVVDANHTIPQTKAEAEKRDEKLKNAIDSLNAMQRPMLALWNLMDYSERIMDEWAGLLDEELRLLEGLRKADKARYKSLK